ncbi:hypothetical protein BDV38DRAFT_274913 [Aspergillus pseudotamarii]|uniref:F-box domain-containing protein n=1 Tax=Aspergillus pseudotamarii TaxID=132259 RepID=A0A5N6SG60_ASPPS|nr:uncharacterized protein BDV38DRAFT_274913 [Aspergillus pseudotamarii]KAE8132710.1 hypothetical protein BDV38DRAFT_274913 [Aspergillus pseudotamarii]
MLHFCVICGVLIRRTSFAPGVLPDDDLQWYQQLRAVSRRESSDVATLSGVGYVDSDDSIIAPLGPESSYRDASATLEEYFLYYEGSQLPWSFFFHAICWDILLQRVPDGLSDLSKFSSIFHNLMYCTTWSRHRYVRPGHDFGGSIQFQKPAGDPIKKIVDEGYRYFLAEHLPPRNVAQILRICGGHRVSPAPTRSITLRSFQGSGDIFSRLPAEVLYMIIELLPSSDIGRLRLASIRFRPDFEMGFALPIEVAVDEDWRKAYFAIRHALSSHVDSAYLQNRQRMWNIVGINASLLAEHMKGLGLSGHLYIDDNDSGLKLQQGLSDLGPGQIITTQLSTNGHEYIRVGSRKLFDRRLILPVNKGEVRKLWLSTVSFNSQKFIAGFRFEVFDSPTQSCRDYSLGYISPGSQVKVEIPISHRIAGFELATRVNGVVGVRVTSWVGDIGDGGPNVAFGTLSLTKGVQRALIVAGFDCFPPGSFNVMLVMDFGGNHGQNLAHLTRIVAHIQEYSAPIVGLTFYFDNQDSMHFGRQGRMEVSSFIDGPAGERVVSITYERAATPRGIVSLQSALAWVFNDAWDFPRVISSPKATGTQLVTWDPSKISIYRPWIAPQKALFKEANQDDNLSSVTGFYSLGHPYVIVGLRLTYQSGFSRDIGDITGRQTPRSVELGRSDSIVIVELFRDRVGLVSINFHTVHRDTGQRTIRGLIDIPPTEVTRPGMGGSIWRYYINLFSGLLRQDVLSSRTPDEREVSIPHGKVVGLWGFLMADDGLHIGLLLLQNE